MIYSWVYASLYLASISMLLEIYIFKFLQTKSTEICRVQTHADIIWIACRHYLDWMRIQIWNFISGIYVYEYIFGVVWIYQKYFGYGYKHWYVETYFHTHYLKSIYFKAYIFHNFHKLNTDYLRRPKAQYEFYYSIKNVFHTAYTWQTQ